MRVLITGSSGFVGKHVVKELEERHKLLTPGHQELNLLQFNRNSYNSDFSDIDNYAHFFHGIDAIVHLAATCGGIGINKDNPGKFIYENLQMGVNVLEGARLAGVKKVVNLGTVCMYPKHTPVPFKEEDIYNGYPEETNAPYGIAKRTIVEMGIAYHRQYGMDVTNLIPVNMAGEYDNFDEYSSHVIPALIRKFEEAQNTATYAELLQLGRLEPADHILIHMDPVTLWGTGSASREFLDAKDCARAIGIALERSTGPQPINLGTGHEITIRDLADKIKMIGEYDAEIRWDASKPDGQPRRSLDITRAKNILRWEPRIPLDETIRRTINWYRNNG